MDPSATYKHYHKRIVDEFVNDKPRTAEAEMLKLFKKDIRMQLKLADKEEDKRTIISLANSQWNYIDDLLAHYDGVHALKRDVIKEAYHGNLVR